MGNAVVHFEVMAQDRKKIAKFFSDLFGWRVDADNPMGYGIVAHSENYGKGGVGIGGGIFGDMPAGQDGVTFYVEVDDVDAALKKVEDLGGTRMMGPSETGGPVFGHLEDPEGHWIGLFQRGSMGPLANIPADAEPKGAPVVHFEIVGKNLDTLRTFYGELFGWRLDTDNPVGYGIVAREENLTAEGIGIGGGIMALPPDAGDYPGHVTWYVAVPDVEATLQRAEQLGGQRMMGPESVPGGPTIGQFADPEGHVIGVLQAE